ncbi:hypothetical protein E2C01_082365 [Portunus trituberculatus]|uniref:Uncharacterized protein n=1 Tax=Portunus trituberculatus TaxID=210409 RepID=A0A5B7IZ17_PORTR|nr:hypothetical protein [Portunus trituberculatus]
MLTYKTNGDITSTTSQLLHQTKQTNTPAKATTFIARGLFDELNVILR